MTTKHKSAFLKTMDRDVLEAQSGRTIWEHAGDHYTRTRDGQAWKWSRVFGKYMAVNDPQPAPSKSHIMRASRTSDPRPLDAAENDARRAESEHQHADDANQNRS